LHGRIGNANNLIITPDGYSHLYSEDGNKAKYQAAQATLKTYFATNRFLFIGFSFDDVVFSDALKSISDLFDGNTPKHFVLIKESQRDRIEKLELPLILITYKNHDDLPELLNELSNYAELSETIVANQSSITTSAIQNVKPDFDINNPVFNLPFRSKGEGVVGREHVLQELRNQLVSGQQTSIGHAASFNGMGGLGKTQLAVEYAYRYKEEYPNGVMWIAADQDISTQLVTMANNAKWFSPHLETTDVLAKAREKLQNSSDCLIIFDNVESKEQIHDYLPNINAAPHLLITSRMNTIGGFTVLPLTLLNDEESVELLLKEANREHLELSDEDKRICQVIVETLGHLPLAIELAGAYLKRLPSVTFAKYKTLLRSSLDKALTAKNHDSFTNHQKGLFGTLILTEREITQSPLIEDVLRLLSWSATASMSTSLMATLLAVEETELIEPLALGVELRLLSSTENNRYAIHRLLKEIQRELHPLETMNEWGQEICQCMIGWFEERKNEFLELKDYQAEIDHLENWQDLANQQQWQQAIALLWLQAYPLWHLGQYQQSEVLLLKALDLFEQIYKKENKDNQLLKAHLLADLGTIYSHLGKTNRALIHGRSALAIQLTYLDEKHRDVAISYNNIGIAYSNLSQYNEALQNSKKALALQLELFEEKHIDVARSYGNIGNILLALNLYNEALQNSKKALFIRLKLFGEKHPDVAISYNNIGSCYNELKQYNQALENKEKALRLQLEIFGEIHPDVATSYSNIGISYGTLGKHDKALRIIEKALSLQLSLFGEKHPEVATNYHNIGHIYIKLKLYDEAFTSFKNSLSIRIGSFTTNPSDTINTLNGMTETLVLDKRYKTALNELDSLKTLAQTNKVLKHQLKSLDQYIRREAGKSGVRLNTINSNKKKPKRR
jgi:tetratricopeptide (TPR) repeat protein